MSGLLFDLFGRVCYVGPIEWAAGVNCCGFVMLVCLAASSNSLAKIVDVRITVLAGVDVIKALLWRCY